MARPLWTVDLGRVDMGAYDIPSYEWGPASSPIIWNGLVLLQCDTQADSFVLALDAATGNRCGRPIAQELPSWGTPTVIAMGDRAELVTNASNFIRGYDPRTGQELWRLGGSSKITAPTPIFADGLHHRGQRTTARAAHLCGASRCARRSDARAGSRPATRRSRGARPRAGPYMPTPLAYDGILYVLITMACSTRTTSRPARRFIGSGWSRWAADSAHRRSRRMAGSISRTKTARCWSSPPGRRVPPDCDQHDG